jgi:hypothetical protein
LLLLTTQMTKTKSNINQQSLIKGSNVKRVFLYLSRKKSNQIKTLFFLKKRRYSSNEISARIAFSFALDTLDHFAYR